MEVQRYSTSSAVSKIIFQLYVRHIMCAYIFKGWLQYSLTTSGAVLHIPESGIKSCSEGGSLYLHCWTRNQGNTIDYVVTRVTVKIIQSCISLAVFAKFHFKGGAHTCLVAASDIRASRACMWAPPLTKICDKWHETVIGASLSEPHTSVTSLRTRVCIYLCLLACLDQPLTGNFK